MGSAVAQPGVKPGPPELTARSLNHGATREVHALRFWWWCMLHLSFLWYPQTLKTVVAHPRRVSGNAGWRKSSSTESDSMRQAVCPSVLPSSPCILSRTSTSRFCIPRFNQPWSENIRGDNIPESSKNQDLNLPPANSYTLYPQLFTLHACGIRYWK